MNENETSLKPADCVMLLVDLQAGLGFGTESSSRQVLLNSSCHRRRKWRRLWHGLQTEPTGLGRFIGQPPNC
jgi:hypothetical protein